MNVKQFKELVSKIEEDDEEEIVFSFITRSEIEDWYNDGERFDDDVWNAIKDDIGYDGDDIMWSIQTAQAYAKEVKEKQKDEDTQ